VFRKKMSPIVHREKFWKKPARVVNFLCAPVGIVRSFNVFPKAVTRSKRKKLLGMSDWFIAKPFGKIKFLK